MNKIHKLTGIALQNFPAIGICLGAAIGYSLHYFGETAVLFSHRNVAISIFVFLGFSGNTAARLFYSIETFDKHMKNYSAGFRSWRLAPLEPLFYSTMVSNIGIFRKIAGYVYVVSHILLFSSVVALIASDLFDKFLN